MLHVHDTVGSTLREGDTIIPVIEPSPAPRSEQQPEASLSITQQGGPPSLQTSATSNWWEAERPSSKLVWTETLEHNGPLFPPPYEPHGIPLTYNGQSVVLPPEAEEMASWFARYIGTDHVKKPVFCRNFFTDFQRCLEKSNFHQPKIESFELCDFSAISMHLRQRLEERRDRSREDRDAEKQIQEDLKEIYGWVNVDGKREPLGNYRIEPPGLFLGRGEHPMAGRWKRRIMPEDVTLNLSGDSTVPEPSVPGHSWGGIVANQTVSWTAYWKDDLTGTMRYILFAASSSVFAARDRDRFEDARKLKPIIGIIRNSYEADLQSSVSKARQLATIYWMIDRLALRIGSEKDHEDSVGCCSLRVQHIRLSDNNKIVLDFIGKDSLRYFHEVTVPEPVWKNLQSFSSGKPADALLFDLISSAEVSSHLRSVASFLTANIFRIYNVSTLLEAELRKSDETVLRGSLSVPEKVLAFNRANREVAVMCNHMRSTPSSWKPEPKIALYEAELAELRQTQPQSQEKIQRLESKLEKLKAREKEREELKDIVLSTTKVLYIDPRITVSWCKRAEVDIRYIFSKSLQEKFRWAIEEIEQNPDFHF